jgi:hypothetical protein
MQRAAASAFTHAARRPTAAAAVERLNGNSLFIETRSLRARFAPASTVFDRFAEGSIPAP